MHVKKRSGNKWEWKHPRVYVNCGRGLADADSQNADSKNADSQNADSKNADSQNADSKNADSQNPISLIHYPCPITPTLHLRINQFLRVSRVNRLRCEVVVWWLRKTSSLSISSVRYNMLKSNYSDMSQ